MAKGDESMRAVIFDGSLRMVADHPRPAPPPGWARIRIRKAGICKTDMEIVKGYMGFRGILGHEFVGDIDACDDGAWAGRRVVGEINAACGNCSWCRKDLGRHCPNRTTLGIDRLDGAMADWCILPAENLRAVPPDISDDRAVLTEPLSAACEILEQIPLEGSERIVVLGDGRLGTLCAWVLSTVAADVTLVGRHPEKLALAAWRSLKTTERLEDVPPEADIVVEATGSGRGLVNAMAVCRPRGTIVLKSTVAFQGDLNLAPVVIKEIAIQGSRCGRFTDGLRIMGTHPDMPLERLLTATHPAEEAVAAFARAVRPDSLKILLDFRQ